MEIWKDIEGHEGLYQVSNHGRVKSLERRIYKKMYGGAVHSYLRKGRIMSGDKVDGYLQVQLSINDKRTRFKIHRLVAAAFIPNPQSKPMINHIDCNGLNNMVENLEWCTAKENSQHSIKLGRAAGSKNLPKKKGSEMPMAKLTEADIPSIRSSTCTQRELANRYGVSKTAIRYVRNGKNWAHV